MFYIFVPVVLVAGLLAYASKKPNMMVIHREAVIPATPEQIFALISNFHEWSRWSPWAQKDPNQNITFSGAESGPGAVYEWNGDKNVGQGRMEILTTNPHFEIKIQLDFIKPFEGHNVTVFKLTPKDSGTLVSWTMTGPANMMSKLMGTFINMDKMIGTDFEIGLANLKREATK